MTSSTIEKEYNEINANEGWPSAFQKIRDKCDREAKENEFSLNEAKKIENRKLNRYRDVNPYDHSRIVLVRPDTDYINANLVKLDIAERKYILTQGPLQSTTGHFWIMIWEQNSKAILMLNKLIEKDQVKCHMYWPEKMGEEHVMHLTDVRLTVQYLKYEVFNNFLTRLFRLTDLDTGKSRDVIQYHYTTWPDFGIPSSPVAFLQFLKQVRDSGALSPDAGPPIVHCSAGIGRSGTFCLVDCCLVLIENNGESNVSVQDVLLKLRNFRMGLIQTFDQLDFSYQAIIEGIKRLNNPNDNDYKEIPFIPSENEIDETPPPLPPPRSHSLSLTGGQLNNKPLPLIPNSESLQEDSLNDSPEKDAKNNQLIIEKLRECNNHNIYRPLPPLPSENLWERVNESSADDSEGDDIEEATDSDKSKSGQMDDEKESNYSDSAVNWANSEMNTLSPSSSDIPSPSSSSSLLKRDGTENANSLLLTSDSGKEASNELRRRTRQERQQQMEERLREIKRKQKICEEKAYNSPKKRRFLMISIAAGVLFGVICVYAYTKLG